MTDSESTANQKTPSLPATQNLVDALFVGVKDKGGKPIADHSRRCVNYLSPNTPYYVKLATALHDVIEDTPLTFADLRSLGYPQDTLNLLDAVTIRPGESYTGSINRLIGSKLFWALEMKLADNKDNTDPERLGRLDVDTKDRMEQRYAGVRDRLLEAMEDLDPQWVAKHHPRDHKTSQDR